MAFGLILSNSGLATFSMRMANTVPSIKNPIFRMRIVKMPANAPYISIGIKLAGEDESSVARKKAPISV